MSDSNIDRYYREKFEARNLDFLDCTWDQFCDTLSIHSHSDDENDGAGKKESASSNKELEPGTSAAAAAENIEPEKEMKNFMVDGIGFEFQFYQFNVADSLHLRCTACPHQDTRSDSLKYHIAVRHLNHVFECRYCGDRFQSSSGRNYHLRTKHGKMD